MGGVRRTRWEGEPIPVTPLFRLYRTMRGRGGRQMPQRERLACAERYASRPAALAEMFLESLEVFSGYRNDEPFHGGHAPLVPLGPDDPMPRGRDVMRALVGPSGEPVFTPVAGMDLELRLVDYELEPTRTTGNARFEDGTKAVSGMTLDLLMCDRAGLPAVCELKTPGGMDPFFALVQALACAAHLATPAQLERLARHTEGLDVSSGRLDVFVIQVAPQATRRARYQGGLRPAALDIADGLSRHAGVATRIRHLALLDAVRGPSGLDLRMVAPEREATVIEDRVP